MSPEPQRQATIFDVARLAGVSHQTVSRVVNDLPNVRESTKKRVQDAITKLRYVPSPAARALVTRRTRTLGVIATGTPEFGPSSTLLHFGAAARSAQWTVLTASMTDSDPGPVREAVETFLRQNVEGIAVVSSRDSVIDAVGAMGLTIPLVALHPRQREDLPTVGADQYAAARAVVQHLVGLGHRRIRHLAGPPDSFDARERQRGWRDELAANDLPAAMLGVGDWTPASGARAGETIDPQDTTAVFAANDQMAIGLMHSLAERGLHVPDDISIVGFDDIPEAAYIAPPLTTVRQDFASVGTALLASLVQQLGGDPDDETLGPPQFIDRRSTGTPRIRGDLSTGMLHRSR